MNLKKIKKGKLKLISEKIEIFQKRGGTFDFEYVRKCKKNCHVIVIFFYV